MLPPSSIPTSYFTLLFYAFAEPDATTYQLSITQPDGQWMGNFTATFHRRNATAKDPSSPLGEEQQVLALSTTW